MTMTDLFSVGFVEFASACGADPGVRVPTFVYAASNQAALLWRDNIDCASLVSDEVTGELSLELREYALHDISDLLVNMGKSRADIIVCCYDCDVRWSMWADRECWMCGKIGYLYTPRNIRTIMKYKQWYNAKK